MKTPIITRRRLASWHLIAALTLAGGAAFGARHFDWVNTDSDIPGVASYTDALVQNPWGLVTGVAGAVRVADDGTQASTIYGPNGALTSFSGTSPFVHSIAIPTTSSTSGGSPTGVVDNQFSLLATGTQAKNDFVITSGTSHGPSRFIYGTEEGVIAGYNSEVSPDAAVLGGTGAAGAGYTGLALSWSGTGAKVGSDLDHQLYAANFAQGTVDVFSNTFSSVVLSSSAFEDTALPTPPTGYAWSPFNIHTLDFDGKIVLPGNVDSKREVHHLLVVTFALHSSTNAALALNDVPEVGGTDYGAVALFQTDGTFYKSLTGTSGTGFSSPWGVAVSHGPLAAGYADSIVLLIGNHGTGTVNAWGINTVFPDLGFKNFGLLEDLEGNTLTFQGLWTLHFPTVPEKIATYIATGGADLIEDRRSIYFSAGIASEMHGIIGRIFP